jgi:hypothetical protein
VVVRTVVVGALVVLVVLVVGAGVVVDRAVVVAGMHTQKSQPRASLSHCSTS